MPRFALTARRSRRWLPAILWTHLSAQTCLVLSQATITSGNTALLDLSLYSPSGTAPAALQWTFQYTSSISSFTVDDGPTLTSAGKSAICAEEGVNYNCLAVGLNANTINNGVIAKITAVLAPGASAPIIRITNPLAASASGNLIPIAAMIPPIPGARNFSDCRLPPRPRDPVGH